MIVPLSMLIEDIGNGFEGQEEELPLRQQSDKQGLSPGQETNFSKRLRHVLPSSHEDKKRKRELHSELQHSITMTITIKIVHLLGIGFLAWSIL